MHNITASLKAQVWARICSHIDGIALGTTVWTLGKKGVLARLAGNPGPWALDSLAGEFNLRPGYFHLAMRLLATQGFVQRQGELSRGGGEVQLTDSGRSWLNWLPLYEGMPEIIKVALAVPACLEGKAAWDSQVLSRISNTCLSPASELEKRVSCHVQGPLIGVLMYEGARRDVWEPLSRGSKLDLPIPPGAEPLWEPVWELLAQQGWVRRQGTELGLTEAGRIAVQMAGQYLVPVSYLPTFLKVPELLQGEDDKTESAPAAGIEGHIDRKLDIQASGRVFTTICREPFLEIVLPLFDQVDLGEQPQAVVDTGSGDGTLLAELYGAIVKQTRRGRNLQDYPLVMVGAEFQAVARAATAARLQEADVPHRTIFGDIGNPEGVAQELRQHNMDPDRVLHVSKSVIHNRTFRVPGNFGELFFWEPISQAVFVAADGGLISPLDLELNLIEHFQTWKPWVSRHGMIVIEAHTVDPRRSAALAGRQIVTALEAYHGYSRQYLVEVEVFRRCAAAAGLKTLASRDLAVEMMGRPLLSIDHFGVGENS